MLSPHRAPLKRGTKAGSLLVHQLTAPLPRSGFVPRLDLAGTRNGGSVARMPERTFTPAAWPASIRGSAPWC